MTETRVCGANDCDNPADDGYICRPTITDLEQLLAETPWLVHELDVAITKQTRFAAQGGKVTTKGAAQPLILNPDAAESLAHLNHTLLSWQANIADLAGIPVRYPKPAHSAAWLMSRLDTIRIFEAAGDLYNEIKSAHKHARNMIDRPPERRYLGDCGSDEGEIICPEPLWGLDKETEVFCKVCGTEWNQAARLVAIRDQAVTGLNDRIMTASEAAGVLVAYNLTDGVDAIRITDRIRKWAAQPADPAKKAALEMRIELRHVGERSRPGYKFGDILTLLNRRKRDAS